MEEKPAEWACEAGTLSNEKQSYGYNSLRPLKVIYFLLSREGQEPL